ncbi:MAG: TonB-dependent receptor [Alphaproteobacteria bacterium]|nr:TonB-dependent receptor [Alphaproteobacteria bacterium]
MALSTKTRWMLASASVVSISMMMAQTALAQATDSGELKLETIVVTGTRGFGTDVSQLGTFRGAHLIDTPMTIVVLPKDLLNAEQATNLTDILKNIAGANSAQVGTVVTSNQSIRGIPIDNRNGFRMDGSLPFVNLIELPVEDKERVEVMKGAAGLYYGFASPAGVINVTMKRPTADPLFDAKLFGNEYGGPGAAVDFGGTVANGKFGYRINGVYTNEDPGIDHALGIRSLISGAFDYKPIESVTMQVDVEHIFKTQPEPGVFRMVSGLPTPTIANPYPTYALPNIKTLDPRTNFGPRWALYRAEETNLMSHNVWSINDAWQLTIDVGDSRFDRNRVFNTLQPTNFITGAGFMQFQFAHEQDENRNARFEVSGTFSTFGLVHNASAGWQDNIRDSLALSQAQAVCAGGVYTTTCQKGVTTVSGVAVNYINPTFVPLMTLQLPQTLTGTPDRTEDAGFYIFDRISWGNYVDVLAGGRFGNYNDIAPTVPVIHKFHAAPMTTSDSIVVKPFGDNDLSIYASYVEALESAGGAPITALNAGQTLAPLPSMQREIGVKSEYLKGFLLTFDYFDIRRASTYVNAANYYVEDGQAKYNGFEFSASGEVTEDLSVFANGMLLMAKQVTGAPTCGVVPYPVTATCHTFTPTIVGLNVSNSAKAYGTFFAQYKLDDFIQGLSVNGGIYYVGARPVDATNKAFLRDYFTVDLGASYSTDAFEYPMTFRVNAQNVGNTKFWASGDADLFAEGQPANIIFSLEAHL